MILDDKITIKVNASNFKHYFNLGYESIKVGDVLEVPFNELPKSSEVIVNWMCDTCGYIKETKLRPSRYTGQCRSCANKVQALGSKRSEEYCEWFSEKQKGVKKS